MLVPLNNNRPKDINNMRNSNLNNTIKSLQTMNQSIDDIKDTLEYNGMTHYIEMAHSKIKHAQSLLDESIDALNEYKASTQPETKQAS